jgi:hypothetical protein
MSSTTSRVDTFSNKMYPGGTRKSTLCKETLIPDGFMDNSTYLRGLRILYNINIWEISQFCLTVHESFSNTAKQCN